MFLLFQNGCQKKAAPLNLKKNLVLKADETYSGYAFAEEFFSMSYKISVGSKCIMGDVCSHICKITLTNGREKELALSGKEIFALLKNKDNVVKNIWGEEHFAKYAKNPDGSLRELKTQDIIAKVFS